MDVRVALAGSRAQDLFPWPQRGHADVFVTPAPRRDRRVGVSTRHLGREARLADAWFATDQHHAHAASGNVVERILEHRQRA